MVNEKNISSWSKARTSKARTAAERKDGLLTVWLKLLHLTQHGKSHGNRERFSRECVKQKSISKWWSRETHFFGTLKKVVLASILVKLWVPSMLFLHDIRIVKSTSSKREDQLMHCFNFCHIPFGDVVPQLPTFIFSSHTFSLSWHIC